MVDIVLIIGDGGGGVYNKFPIWREIIVMISKASTLYRLQPIIIVLQIRLDIDLFSLTLLELGRWIKYYFHHEKSPKNN